MSQLTVLSDEIAGKHKNPCSSSPRVWTLMYHPLPPQCFWMCSFCQSRCSVVSWRWQEEAVISKVDQDGCLVWHSPEAQPVPGYPHVHTASAPCRTTLLVPFSAHLSTLLFPNHGFHFYCVFLFPEDSLASPIHFSVPSIFYFTFLVWVGYVHTGKGHV